MENKEENCKRELKVLEIVLRVSNAIDNFYVLISGKFRFPIFKFSISKRTLLILPILTGSFFLLNSCDHEFYQGDFFFLVSKQATMPIVVRGNKASGIFILFIHGGPGGTGLQKIGLPVFDQLEQDYATVFYDQRSSGSSQGNSPDKYLTLEQFEEDLDKVIDLINAKYNSPKIFMMGHSWGGCLGTGYLTDPVHQNKITGWIECDGAHNNPTGDSLSLQFVTAFAKQQLSVNQDEGIWNYALDWYSKNPNFTSDQLEHYAFLEKAHGYIHDPTLERTPMTFPDYTADYVLNSPADVTAQLTNYNHVIKKFIISDIDLTPLMKNITIPSLIIWGQYDGVIPLPMAQHAYDALGTPVNKKSILILPDAAHYSFYEVPGLCADGITNFIEKYR
jgi:proline iminopeptidase